MNFRRYDKSGATSTATRVALAVVGFGVVLRIAQFATNRSLWLDEALLALNIANRSFIQLAQPLSDHQGAPIGFLFIQKFIIEALGNNDYVLRLLPLGAGIASLLAMYKVASIYLEKTGTLVAVGLFAVSPKLIYYASEVKQYSSDTLISLLLLFLAYKCLGTQAYPKRYIALMAAGAASMWISHAAFFVLVGIGSGLALDQLLRQDRRGLAWIGILSLIWIINAAILYLISLRHLPADPSLINYWRNAFMPMPPWREPAWVLKAFLAMFENPVGLVDRWAAAIGMALFGAGCLSLFFRKWQLAFILIVPFPVVLLASSLEKYPFGDRLLLFIVPIVLLLIGEGIDRIRSFLLNVSHAVAFGVYLITAVLLLYGPTNAAVQNLWHPNMGEHIKPVISYIRQRKLDADFVYVYYGASAAFSYYAPLYGFEQKDYSVGIRSREEPIKYTGDVDRLAHGRVWFVFSHNCNWCPVDEEAYFLKHLDTIGTRINEFRATGASVYLYNLDSPNR